jgi:hypothetical protein
LQDIHGYLCIQYIQYDDLFLYDECPGSLKGQCHEMVVEMSPLSNNLGL